MTMCESCGGDFPMESMPSWTLCAGCYEVAVRENYGEDVYIDGLGIVWTPEDLAEAGGRAEVDKLVAESRATIAETRAKSKASTREHTIVPGMRE